jgi:hypothetical protein
VPKEKKQIECVDEDYIWRFRLDDLPKERSTTDVTVEYIRRQLEELLNFVRLTYNEKNVKINGFKFINNVDMNYHLFGKPENDSHTIHSKTMKKK